jgi:mRNA interferase RelE/StbE
MSEKSWSVEFSKSALKALERLDKTVSPRILDYLESLAETENPLRHKDVRSLEGKLKAYYRLRVGEYRVIFELDVENRRIGVLAIVPRGGPIT